MPRVSYISSFDFDPSLFLFIAQRLGSLRQQRQRVDQPLANTCDLSAIVLHYPWSRIDCATAFVLECATDPPNDLRESFVGIQNIQLQDNRDWVLIVENLEPLLF